MDFRTAIPFLPSRRRFLKRSATLVGGLVLGIHIPPGNRARAAGAMLEGPFDPNVFLRIGTDSSVTIISKYFEMGQGVTTGLATLIAEELEADWTRIGFEFAPNDPGRYNNLVFGPYMATGGSTSMAGSWVQMRKVGAAARHMLVSAAAQQWGVPAGEIRVEGGVLSHAGSDRRTSFGELAEAAMRLPVPAEVNLKPEQDWKLIGKRIPRLDSVSKTTGTATFAQDIRRPGMLTAVIKRPELFGGKVASFDAGAAQNVPGVVEVVQVPMGVAVLATDTWSALRGREALQVSWDNSQAETRSTAAIFDEYRQLLTEPGLDAVQRGDAAGRLAAADQVLDLEFTFPYLAHAPMEPLNCVMELGEDSAEIWSGCQLQSIDSYVASRVLGFPLEKITIHTLLGGGSFGRRGNPSGDWVIELASIAKAMAGRTPVHLVWTREDDIRGGFYRPMALHRVKVGLDSNGRIAGWQHQLVSQSIFTGTPFEAMTVRDGLDASSVEGVADTPYAIADFLIQVYNARSAVPVLWWRSVGHSHTAQVMETVVDELAHLAGKDPVAFRAGLLSQTRDLAVLELAAAKSGWGDALPEGRGRGIAYHESFGTRVAMVAEVSVTGTALEVDRIIAAVDCGVAVNPDVVTAQIEGAIGFALSSILRNRVTLAEGLVEQSNFHDYEPTRMREMPEVEVHIVKSGEPPTGIGEPGLPPLAPAIGNAIFAATGKRLRSLPYDLRESG